jgi:hypothetical protein
MKRIIYFLIVGLILLSTPLFAQKPTDDRSKTDDRMKRDIAVMETALSEMIKQELNQRNFFFMDIKGNYVSGYGVTFTVPTSMISNVWSTGSSYVMSVDGNVSLGGLTLASPTPDSELMVTEKEALEAKEAMKNPNKTAKAQKERDRAERDTQVSRNQADRVLQEAREAEREATTVYGLQSRNGINGYTYSTGNNRKRFNTDSLNAVSNAKIIEAAKTFIADYGDMLSQLGPNERIVVTNRGSNENHVWLNGAKAKRSLLSVEATKSDLTQFRQGGITRDQMLKKMKVVNTTTSEKAEPDMELLASIFNRLYREDLSRTYYMQGGAYYERLTDFGVILHMQVVSSIGNDYNTQGKEVRLTMPTLGLSNLTQEERDKKVKELYPVFESELKENILDYGRTLKSLNDNEQLIVDVTMTKCTGCGIPASLEVAVKASVLKDFNAGKLDKSAALSKIEVKKGPNQ